MRRTHSFLVLISFLGAVALAGCGVHSYTTVEAKDATDGLAGFLFDGGRDVRGTVTVRERSPGYDVQVRFEPQGQVMPEIRDVRASLDSTRWGRPVPTPPQQLQVDVVACSHLRVCAPIGATVVSGPRARALAGDDLVLTLSYMEEVDGRPVQLTREVRVHPARAETHHYPWIFRDC